MKSREKVAGAAAVCAAVFESKLGWIATVWQGGRLFRMRFGYPDAQAALAAAEISPAEADAVLVENRRFAKRLRAYAAGRPDDFRDLEIMDDDLTDFQRRVVVRCRNIRFGQTTTYGELAASVGSPGAARAVGSVMANNRLPLIVPCHRVVAAGGALGGYSAPDGLAMKRRLLALERGSR